MFIGLLFNEWVKVISLIWKISICLSNKYIGFDTKYNYVANFSHILFWRMIWKTRPEQCDIYFWVVLHSWTFVSDLSNSYYLLSVITDANPTHLPHVEKRTHKRIDLNSTSNFTQEKAKNIQMYTLCICNDG